MAKHNKKRNTAFIYEVVIREIIKQTINKNKEKRNVAIQTIKEIFKKGTELRKELDLYKTLLETKGLNERVAEKLVFEVFKQHRNVDLQKLFKEQSNAIAIINKEISKDVFNNFVPNYKNLATIAQMFGQSVTPKTKVLLETKIIKDMSDSQLPQNKTAKVSPLVVKTFIKKFNDVYGDLLAEQKELFSKYVFSFQDGETEFRFHLNEEITRLRTVINDSYKLKEVSQDETLKNKLDGVKQVLQGFSKEPLDKNWNQKFLQILQIQNLAKELQS